MKSPPEDLSEQNDDGEDLIDVKDHAKKEDKILFNILDYFKIKCSKLAVYAPHDENSFRKSQISVTLSTRISGIILTS
jgi:hypothetical protein